MKRLAVICGLAGLVAMMLSGLGADSVLRRQVLDASAFMTNLLTSADAATARTRLGVVAGTGRTFNATQFAEDVDLNVVLIGGVQLTNPVITVGGNLIDLTGFVTGPATSTDNAVVRWDGATGRLVKNSGVTVDDS